MVQNLVILLIDALTVEEMEKSDLIKAFLRYNKRVHNVMVVVRKLQILVMIVMDKERNKHLKKYQLQFLKALMMEQGLD